jgi:hypothetical protein
LEGGGYDKGRRGKYNIYVVKKGEKQGVGKGLPYLVFGVSCGRRGGYTSGNIASGLRYRTLHFLL